MKCFDAGRDWVILAPQSSQAARELAHHISILRKRAGSPVQGEPEVRDSQSASGNPAQSVILLSGEELFTPRPGLNFSWRAGEERIELYGTSARSLLAAVHDFLEALGFRWLEPGETGILPPHQPEAGTLRFPLAADRGSLDAPGEGPRLTLAFPVWERSPADWLLWASRNLYSQVLFLTAAEGGRSRALFSSPFAGIRAWDRQRAATMEIARETGITLGLGGWCLPFLLPSSLFFFHKDLFRMAGGRRRKDVNLCPTHPEALSRLGEAFSSFAENHPEAVFFPFWDDECAAGKNSLSPARNSAHTWCSCPTCRAFSPAEQLLIVQNAAAVALARVRPEAFLERVPADDGEVAITPSPGLRFRPRPGEDGGAIVRSGLTRNSDIQAAWKLPRELLSRTNR